MIADRPARRGRSSATGQSLAEFALVLPVLIAVIGGIIQFGMIFWAQNTLTQVVRDAGRYAATQGYCRVADAQTATPTLLSQINTIAGNSSLLGYASGQWSTLTNEGTSDAGFPSFGTEGVAVAWVKDTDPNSQGCPPKDNQASYHVTIKINHSVPTFFPGLQYLPGIGVNGQIMLSSMAQFRMEPAP